MRAAKKCGVRVPEVSLLDFGKPVLAVERFDRVVTIDEEGLRVERIHQEDFAQAFGMTSASKYVELPNGSITSIAQWIRSYAAKPAEDLSQFAKAVCFNYLIGNCDAHLKTFQLCTGLGKEGQYVAYLQLTTWSVHRSSIDSAKSWLWLSAAHETLET